MNKISFESRVRYGLESELGGMKAFAPDAAFAINLLYGFLLKVQDYEKRVDGIRDQTKHGIVLDEMFPRNFMYDMCPNPMNLPDELIGQDVHEVMDEKDLKKLGVMKMYQSKTARLSKKNPVFEYRFEDEVYKFDHPVRVGDVYEMLEKHARFFELRSLGLDVRRAYQATHVVAKPTDIDEKIDVCYKFGQELSYAVKVLESAFCFNMKLSVTEYLDEINERNLDAVYTKFSFMNEDLTIVKQFSSEYWDLCQKYNLLNQKNLWSFRFFNHNNEHQDIIEVKNLYSLWEEFENRLWGYLQDFTDNNVSDDIVQSLEGYLEILLEDKVLITDLNQFKEIEASFLLDNCKFQLQEMQQQINTKLNRIVDDWRYKFEFAQTLNSFDLPKTNDFGVKDYQDFEKVNLEVIARLEQKYINLFLDEVDLSELFEHLDDEEVDLQNVEFSRLVDIVRTFEFSNKINDLKYEIFINNILQLICGSSYWETMRSVLAIEQNKYKLIDKLSLENCHNLDEYLRYWEINHNNFTDDQADEIKNRIKQAYDEKQFFKLSAEYRHLLRDLMSNDKLTEEKVCLSDYGLSCSSKLSLNLRQIQAFMKVLEAEKYDGSSSHMKYKVDLGDGSHYSYTISNTVIQSDKYFANKLLQDISIAHGELRMVSRLFVDRLSEAFAIIGLELSLRA